ncbi:pyridoxal phosphate-dependent aminotransferase [Thalassospira lucentensis]|uniref:Aminotransferase n=1 Tax=Thalassospira lucentensis TaxID=168935 RepID=A0A358HS88_9PROT|nr:aminotransferase class I/II-fold pyridoxal phosphate-dependent enzyme [Thalassospira lucentensis]HBU97644.1 1-aminocyclopropane-1-carboxylate deaminase [Thalassospira lucentensis]HCW67123.1 1-aminocyclopropane-1-carboxylate deaminase [Thalassospira lucentensis]
MALKQSLRGAISPFIVMDVMRAANARENDGKAVFHLEVGQPGTPAPRKVREAAAKALEADLIGYTNAMGIDPLRDAIAGHYKSKFDVSVDPARVCVASGSSSIFVLAFLAAFDADDRVAMAAPGYPAYHNILSALGIETVNLPAGPETHYQPTVSMLRDLEDPIDGLIVASPSNPAGSMIDVETYRELATYCRENGIRLISDEIYQGISFGDVKDCTALEFGDDAIIINSFSKYFSMTGWRLGWAIVPPDLMRAVECLQQNLFISAPALSQIAAVAAFDCEDELQANIAAYARNREILLDGLPKAGFTKFAPADGAFYLYADVRELTNDSEAFCKRMLDETGVATTPGTDFDRMRGKGYVRFSFAHSEETMIGAVKALQDWKR